eukprot:TRINITY_DN6365_c0_g1_i1.p3 TRINITY_DN6365_c0_g1~~TRINITY_DN6365_c0_g1_i1.p3  ORF type:complete len:123 (+),score=7.71 TRINITY_DN6365_c0_g1_i1:157-525(+)
MPIGHMASGGQDSKYRKLSSHVAAAQKPPQGVALYSTRTMMETLLSKTHFKNTGVKSSRWMGACAYRAHARRVHEHTLDDCACSRKMQQDAARPSAATLNDKAQESACGGPAQNHARNNLGV